MASTDGGDQVVNARNAGREVLDCFYDLADTSSEKRNAAVATLIAEIKKQDNQDSLLAYVFNRILKGLGSGRGAARQGFASALTALLEGTHAKDTAEILKLSEQHLSLTGAKGTDEKNVLLGQLFFHASLLQARRLDTVARAKESITALFQIAKKRSFLYEACTSTVLDVLDGLPSDAAAQLIDSHEDIQALINCSREDATPEALMVALHLWPLLSVSCRKACRLLPEGTAQPSPDLFQRPAKQNGSTNGKAASTSGPTHSEADKKAAADFFAASNLKAISHILKDASFVRHQLHSVWLHVLRLLIPSFVMKGHKGASESHQQSAKQQELGKGHLAALWATVIESGLLFSSLERKAVAMQLFCVLLPHIAAADVPIVFSTPFVRLLGSSLKGKEQSLHKGAVRCIDRLTDWAQTAHKNSAQDPRPAVLFALSAHGHAGCDGIVKVKAVTRLSNSVDVAALEQYVQRLLPAFWRGRLALEGMDAGDDAADDPTEDEEAAERIAQSTRIWVIGQLGIIAKSPSCSSTVAATILEFLATVAFAEAGPKAHKSKVPHVQGLAGCRVALSEDIRSLAASRTAAIATDALPCARGQAAAGGDGEADGARAPAAGGEKNTAKQPKVFICLLHKVLEYLDTLEDLPESAVSLLEPDGISPVVKQRLKAMMAACDRGRSSGKPDAAAAHMHVLLGMLRLTLCTSAAHDAAELIVDLFPSVGPILGVELPAIDEGGEGGSDASMDGDAGEQGTGWVNQLTECLLSLLSDSLGSVPMAVMRVAAEGVWRSAAPHVNAVALSDLLQVLLRLDQKAVAEEAMFEGEDEEDEEEVDDDDEEDEDDDEGEEGSDEEDEGEKEEAGGEGEGGKKLARGDAGQEGVGDGEEDSEDEGLDDDAMFRLDKQLAKYFSTMKGGREGLKLRNEALRKFQLRVLALIEIWAKKQPASPLVALVPVPLLRALRIASRPSGHPPLAQRLQHVLRQQVQRCRPVFPPNLAVDGLAAPEETEGSKLGKTGLEQVMSRVMYFATRESDGKVLSAATASYTMLLRGLISAAQRGEAEGGGGDSLARTAMHAAVDAVVREVFDKRKSRWSYENVAGMLKAAQDVLPVLMLPALLEKAAKARTEFLRIEALRLCAVCLRFSPRQLQAFQALKVEGKMVKAVTEAVAAGYANTGRRLGGLHACADTLEGLCKLHGNAGMSEFCPEKRLNGLRVAVKQVQALDNLPAKCKTQLQRIQKLLDRQGGGPGSGKRKRQGDGAAGPTPDKSEKASKSGKKRATS